MSSEKHLLHATQPHHAPRRRVGLLGVVHETNTFEAGSTGYAAFAQPADREPLMQGDALWAMRGTRSVMGGMLEVLEQLPATEAPELLPLYRASAAPSAMVASAAWQRIRSEALQAVAQAGPLDGLLIEFHGAMVAEDALDCEGELLAALRASLGPQCVLVATLDFHANVSPAMVAHADVLVPYRTYPHIDMFETGQRAARRMRERLGAYGRGCHAWAQAPFLIPLAGQYTGDGAMGSFMQDCGAVAQRYGVDVAFCGGFVLADTPDTGPSLVVYAPEEEQDMADRALHSLMERLQSYRSALMPALWAPSEAVARLRPQERSILADVADNPGAGCAADNLAILCALHDAAIPRSLVATLNLPHWASLAHAAGVGCDIVVELPGRAQPATLQVLALSDGHYRCNGAMWLGREVRQGPTARLRWGAVELIVASQPVQALDPGALACTGVSADDYQVLSLKSSVHFRAAFGPWAQTILNVDAFRQAGDPAPERIYQRLRSGVAVLS
ncbi:MAG: M81 family metallopeptidase [Acidovorax sp.]|nr:M81 family metallopeptidase [Acidovorax sp.]